MSTSVIDSSLRSLRRKESTDSSIDRIWSRSCSIRLRCESSSMNSERRRIRVIGVRRSWLMAASILVRSSIKAVIRSRMRLSALATERISSGPRSGSGAAAPFRLKLSAAFANDDSGAVRARAAHRPSRLTQITANSRVVIQGPRQNGRSHCSGGNFAEIIAPSGSAMPTLRPSGPGPAKRSDRLCRGGDAGRAGRDRPPAPRRDRCPAEGLRCPIAETPARCRRAAVPARPVATRPRSWAVAAS